MPDLIDYLPLFTETTESIRERMDTNANAGLEDDDPRWVDTREGTFYWDATQPAVLEFARLYDALALEVPASAFPLFSWGIYLDYHAAIFNLERKPGLAASGEATFTGDPGTFVASGTVISADATTEDGEVIEFLTTEAGTISDQLDPPTGLALTPGTTGGSLDGDYYYRVSTLSIYGESTGSAVETATAVGPTGTITVDWDDDPDAAGYRVYRSEDNAVFYRVYSGSANTFEDTGVADGLLGPPVLNSTAGVTLEIQASETGADGNLAVGAITNLDSVNAGVDNVVNNIATASGTDVETDEALRERILFEFEGQGAGNQNDYRSWALAEPGVAQAHVIPAWNGPNTVLVVVMGTDGGAVSSDVVDSLQARLDPLPGLAAGQAPVGAVVTVTTPAVIDITVGGTITFKDGYSLDGGGGLVALRTQIEAALRAYIDNLNVGDDVIYDHVKAQFYSVPGVYTVADVTVNGGTSDVSIDADPAEVAQFLSAALS